MVEWSEQELMNFAYFVQDFLDTEGVDKEALKRLYNLTIEDKDRGDLISAVGMFYDRQLKRKSK